MGALSVLSGGTAPGGVSSASVVTRKAPSFVQRAVPLSQTVPPWDDDDSLDIVWTILEAALLRGVVDEEGEDEPQDHAREKDREHISKIERRRAQHLEAQQRQSGAALPGWVLLRQRDFLELEDAA
jgi:hypothetical protein